MNNTTHTFTTQQIKDWRAYEKVRRCGKFNMYDPRARDKTGLSKEDYLFAIKNFAALRLQAERRKA